MNNYTKPEDKTIRDNAKILTAAEIGKLINRSAQSVRRRASKLDVSLDKFADYSPEEDRTIEKYAKTKSAAEIGKMLGRSRQGIQCRAGVLGISLMKHGEHHHKAVHSNDDVRLVRALVEDGELTSEQIAEKMEMSINTVHAIRGEHIRTQDSV
ncbi:hypothetical protein ABKY54_004154 [Vibrio harveyi]